MNRDELDVLTRKHSAFASFQDLLDAKGGYRPTILIAPGETEREALADAYDEAQAARGDARRAFRGSSHRRPAIGDRVSFYRLNAHRNGRVDKVGTKRVLVSYVTKAAAHWASKRGTVPARFSVYFDIDQLQQTHVVSRWQVRS